MLCAIALGAMLGLTQPVDKFTLQFYQETFVARKGSVTLRLPLKPPTTPPVAVVAFRRDQTFAVWDDRGLSLRHRRKLVTTKLEGLPVSPKLFEKPEIQQTISQIKQGKRAREADALSGSRRIGPNAYFLVRWDTSGGKPWLEALIKVDLTSTDPKPILLGRFDGLSLADKPISDRLMILDGKLAILGRAGKNWNLDTYDPASEQFESQKLGDSLVAFALDSPKTGVFVEKTPYGTSRTGMLDLAVGSRRGVTESPGQTRFIDAKHPLLFVERRPTGSVLANGETGALRELDEDSGVGRIGPYVIIWSPRAVPTQAQLLDPERWESLGSWVKNAPH